MSGSRLRTATRDDAEGIRVLLEHNGLPTSDLMSSQPQFIVACEGKAIVATGALQFFGASALLRSVVVASGLRGTGLGRIVVEELERAARAAHITQLVLLTETAKEFFEHQGYRVLERRDVPQDVRESEEFRSLCPASATCMAKTLASPS
jgi:amino-acid N-acetyltransferase